MSNFAEVERDAAGGRVTGRDGRAQRLQLLGAKTVRKQRRRKRSGVKEWQAIDNSVCPGGARGGRAHNDFAGRGEAP